MERIRTYLNRIKDYDKEIIISYGLDYTEVGTAKELLETSSKSQLNHLVMYVDYGDEYLSIFTNE